MNMTSIREKSKIFLWVCLIGFILSLVGVMGTANGGGFLGGASLTSMFSNTVNPALHVGKVNNKNISRRAFSIELQTQRNAQTQFQISTSEQYYIGRAWESIIQNTITDEKIKELNLKTQDAELKEYLLNSPPRPLQDFLIQNNIFKKEDNSFDLSLYQESINNNLSWIPDSLINIFSNYELRLKNNEIPRSKLQHLYSSLSTISDNKVNNEYTYTNTKCNIDVFSIDYTKISDDVIDLEEEKIQSYYNENLEDEFSNPESILVDYVLFKNITNDDDSLEVLLNEDLRQKADDFAFNAREDMLGFDEALINDSLKITGTLSLTEKFDNNSGLPIDMGYNRSIIRFAFDNPINSVSDKITTQNGTAIFRILDKSEASNKTFDDVKDQIVKTITKELKKDYAIELMSNNDLSWLEIEEMLNPDEPEIDENPFQDDTEKIKNFQSENGLDSDGKWGPTSQSKYVEIKKEEHNKEKIAVASLSEEGPINGSFKSLGKNYQLMGYLSVMNQGDISKTIDSNNKIYKVKVNTIIDPLDPIDTDKFNTIKDRLINNMSNSIFNNWIQYMRKNAEVVDVRHKSI